MKRQRKALEFSPMFDIGAVGVFIAAAFQLCQIGIDTARIFEHRLGDHPFPVRTDHPGLAHEGVSLGIGQRLTIGIGNDLAAINEGAGDDGVVVGVAAPVERSSVIGVSVIHLGLQIDHAVGVGIG